VASFRAVEGSERLQKDRSLAEIVDLLLTFISVGLGALGGSAFMWLVLGPLVLRKAAPKLVKSILKDVAGLTEGDIAGSDGDFFKAMTKKQGDTFAKAIDGALGNIVQGAPTQELDKLAQSYGFQDAGSAAKQLMGGNPGGGSDGSGLPGGGALSVLEQLRGDGKTKNSFSGIVELVIGLQALQGLQFGSAAGGMPGLPSMGGSGPSTPRGGFAGSERHGG